MYTRSQASNELQYIPEIEKEAKRLRKETKEKEARDSESSSSNLNSDVDLFVGGIPFFENPLFQELPMAEANRTLKELTAPDLNEQPLCITYPNLEGSFELKSGLIHLLPNFHGLAGEDPYKHLKEFYQVCSSFKPQGVSEEHVKLRAFPFSLKDKARSWLLDLPQGSIRTWNELGKLFLEFFFTASRAANIRKEICGIRQANGEILHEYWERFNQLCVTCPNHQISDQLLIQYFYEGLLPMNRTMIDAASGGALMNKTPAAARQLIDNMAENSQQFGVRLDEVPKSANVVNVSSLENKISDLTSLVRQLAVGQLQQARVCGICSVPGHPTDMCPTLQDDPIQQANAVGGFVNQPQRRYDPYSNHYNPGWRDHPNFSYGNQGGQQRYQPPTQFRPPQPAQPSSSGMSLEDIVKSLATNTQQFQQETRTSIRNLKNQMSQLATSLGKLEAQNSGKLPSQAVVNPKEDVNAMMLRSGKELQPVCSKKEDEKKVENEDQEISEDKVEVNSDPSPSNVTNKVVAPFPSRFAKSKKEEDEQGVLETFRKVQVNIPLLEAIKQIPRYAKFLKELCTNKRKLKGNEIVNMGENASAMISRNIPIKCRDPGMISILCVIGKKRIERAMLDLGASINVMPYSIYCELELGSMKETGVIIKLANRSTTHPEGVVEDVLVQVNKLIFPADFFILKTEEDDTHNPATLLLGRPFMMTAKTNIDMDEGTVSVKFDEDIVKFSIYDSMKYPIEQHSLCSIDVVDLVVQDVF